MGVVLVLWSKLLTLQRHNSRVVGVIHETNTRTVARAAMNWPIVIALHSFVAACHFDQTNANSYLDLRVVDCCDPT